MPWAKHVRGAKLQLRFAEGSLEREGHAVSTSHDLQQRPIPVDEHAALRCSTTRNASGGIRPGQYDALGTPSRTIWRGMGTAALVDVS